MEGKNCQTVYYEYVVKCQRLDCDVGVCGGTRRQAKGTYVR